MGLIYHTTQWTDHLWRRHVAHSQAARQLLAHGRQRQPAYPGLAEDLHALLYLRNAPPLSGQTLPWATTLLEQAAELTEWQHLRARCQTNGFAAGVATEAVLEALRDEIPEGPPPAPTPDQASAMRRAVRQAVRAAENAVDAAEGALEGLAEACGLEAGTGLGQTETLQDLERVRQLYQVLRRNPVMQRIAELAGRLSRLGSAHVKTQVRPATGRIVGVRQGGDLSLILPSELLGLRSPNRLHKLQTLQKILAAQALQYDTQGEESRTRGPVIVCLDESSSMAGEAAMWAKAVALALLTTATEQRRAWHAIGFTCPDPNYPVGPDNSGLTHEEHLEPGEPAWELLTTLLLRQSSGGTDFTPPLRRALEVLHEAPSMRQADIVFLTDGESKVAEGVAQAILHARIQEGVQLYAIGVGPDANLSSLFPLATQCFHVSAHPEQDSAMVAPVIALVS